MKYRRVLYVMTAIILVMCFVSSSWADTVYVQAKTAKLRSGKTSLDPVVADLKFGDALQVVKSENTWLQVRTADGATGWIFASKTSSTKPSQGEDSLATLGRGFRRQDASDTTAAAGARGLDKVSETYANRSNISQRDRDAVDRMTASRLSDQEVDEFLKKGGLGEYGK